MDLFKDILVTQDARAKMYAKLSNALPAEIAIYEQTLPEKWNPNHGAAVVVADDVAQDQDTAHDRVLVRVSVHAHSFEMARKLGRSIKEYLLSPIGRLGLAINTRRSTGVIVGPNSLAGGYVATCSYSCGTTKKGI